jgi:hypothetical protein
MNWKGQGCNPELEKKGYPIIALKGKQWDIPVGEELDRLNEICKNCDSRFIIVKTQACPYCDSKDVEKTGVSQDFHWMDMAHEFKCNECEEKFWIYEKSLK